MGVDKNHRSKHTGRFVRLDHSLLSSCAYRAASPNARALLVELAMMDNSRNNGELFLSVRDAADRMGVTDPHVAAAAFEELERLGFIDMTADAHFAVKAGNGSRARQWRLTWLAVPSKSKPATHEYRSAQPADKRGKKRMARGRKALDTFMRKQMPVLKNNTRSPESVWKPNTTIGNTDLGTPVVVQESYTLNGETSLVSVDRRCVEKLHTYSLPAGGDADGQSEGRKHAENAGGVSSDGINTETFTQLRHRLIAHLAAAPSGEQSRVADAARIPKGTLSKFKDGRGLSPHHFVNLQLHLRRCAPPNRAAA